MSDQPEQPNADENNEPTREQRAAEMPDELKVDVDQDKLQAWDDAKGDYGITDEGERPIMVGEGESTSDSDDSDDDSDDDDSDDDDSDDDDADERHPDARPDHENRSSAEPTDGQQT